MCSVVWAHHASQLTARRTRHKSRTGGNLPPVLDCYHQKSREAEASNSPWTQHLGKGLHAPLFFDFWSLLQVFQIVVGALPFYQQLVVVSRHQSCAPVTSTHSFHIPDSPLSSVLQKGFSPASGLERKMALTPTPTLLCPSHMSS